MAAALRLLARRRATAPASLPLLQPLFPASTASYSKPPSTLRAASAIAAGAGLADLLRVQLRPSRVPSLLRLHSNKGGVPASPRQPVNSQTTRSLKLLALALFLLMVSDCKGLWSFFVGELHCMITRGCLTIVVNDLVEQSEIIDEAMEARKNACHLLKEGLDDKACAMFDQGMEDFLKAVAVYEKGLDYIVKICIELPPDTQQEIRMLCKSMHGLIKRKRKNMKNLSRYFETLKGNTKGDWV